mgnify:CR=1 FL=1
MTVKVTLFFTNICNIDCRHCFLDKSLPEMRMEDFLFKKILREIYQVKDRINLISISGGEPMLFLDEIVKMVDEIHFRHELKISISTNAFWASTREKSENVCERLIKSNIRRLEISYDKFHAEFISIGNIYNAVEACKKWGITAYAVISVENGYDYLPIYIELKKFFGKNQIIIQHVANYGNAQQHKMNCMLPIHMFRGERCSQVLNPCIDYKANFYACCGANILSDDSPMLVGNMNNDSFVTLVHKMNNFHKYQTIFKDGPLQLCPSLGDVKECSSLCELCEVLLRR